MPSLIWRPRLPGLLKRRKRLQVERTARVGPLPQVVQEKEKSVVGGVLAHPVQPGHPRRQRALKRVDVLS